MGRVMALDVGDRRIGIAMSDESRLIATPHSVYERVGWGPDGRYIKKLAEDNQVDLIVSGLPKNMDGSVGFQAQKVLEFCEVLKKLGLTVEMQDERLSTVSAHGALIEGNMHREDRKHVVDKVAAAFILETWLDKNRT